MSGAGRVFSKPGVSGRSDEAFEVLSGEVRERGV